MTQFPEDQLQNVKLNYVIERHELTIYNLMIPNPSAIGKIVGHIVAELKYPISKINFYGGNFDSMNTLFLEILDGMLSQEYHLCFIKTTFSGKGSIVLQRLRYVTTIEFVNSSVNDLMVKSTCLQLQHLIIRGGPYNAIPQIRSSFPLSLIRIHLSDLQLTSLDKNDWQILDRYANLREFCISHSHIESVEYGPLPDIKELHLMKSCQISIKMKSFLRFRNIRLVRHSNQKNSPEFLSSLRKPSGKSVEIKSIIS